MRKGEKLNEISGHRFAYCRWGTHVTPGGNYYGWAGYTHAGDVTYLGRNYERARATIEGGSDA